MNADAPLSADVQKKEDNRRKRKALLAGGVVLGLGAAVTLAAWSDDVFADGTFNTGGFELVGAMDGETFENYDGPGTTAPETASLSFDLTSEEMAPSQTVYSPLTIATSSDTDHAGSFFIESVSAEGAYAPLLTYRVFDVPTHGANCNATDASALATDPDTTEWTNPDGALDGILDELTNSLPLIGDVLSTVTGTLPETSRPVIDPLPVTALNALEVGPNTSSPQHLCLAVTMGIVPGDPLIPGVELDGARLVNNTAVGLIEAGLSGGDGATTVTWTFNGVSEEA